MKKIKNNILIALKIREEIQNIYKKYNTSTKYSDDSPNPFYHQTDENIDGYIVEYYYDSPSKIYTSLGSLDITTNYMIDDDNVKQAIKEIEEKFGFKLKKEAVKNSMGVFGEWYYVTKLPWDDTIYDCECKERDKKDYIDYDTANRMYKEIISQNKE